MFQVSIDKLRVSPKNVRKVGAENIDDLLVSIPEHGLLQNIFTVEPGEKKGHFDVLAGGRRLRALHVLAKRKAIPAKFMVNCEPKKEGADAEAVSLAENTHRAKMHEVDEFRAFAALAEKGKSHEEIGAQFGVTPAVVKRRLKLARVASEILDAFVAKEIGLDEVMAFTLTDDLERQRNIFAQKPNARAWQIKQTLTASDIPATDKRVRFVTVEAYEAEGGAIARDLFTDGDGGIFLTDAALLDRLFSERIDALKAEIVAEGWKECVFEPNGHHALSQQFRGRIYPEISDLTEEQQSEQEALNDDLENLGNQLEDDPDNADLVVAFDTLEKRIEAFNVEKFDPVKMAEASAAIVFDYSGKISIHRGLLKRAEKSAGAGKISGPAVSADGIPTPSARMQDELAAVRTAIVAADLASNPHVALAATVHAMAQQAFARYTRVSAVQIKFEAGNPQGVIAKKDMRPLLALDERLSAMREAAPQNPVEWWAYFLAMADKTLLDHLALFNALAVRSFGYVDPASKVHGDQLADALGSTPEQWVTLSDLDFLARSTKATILAAVGKVKGKDRADNLSGMKKAALVERATTELDGAWLPAELARFATDKDQVRFSENVDRGAALYDDTEDDNAGDHDDDDADDEFNEE